MHIDDGGAGGSCSVQSYLTSSIKTCVDYSLPWYGNQQVLKDKVDYYSPPFMPDSNQLVVTIYDADYSYTVSLYAYRTDGTSYLTNIHIGPNNNDDSTGYFQVNTNYTYILVFSYWSFLPTTDTVKVSIG